MSHRTETRGRSCDSIPFTRLVLSMHPDPTGRGLRLCACVIVVVVCDLCSACTVVCARGGGVRIKVASRRRRRCVWRRASVCGISQHCCRGRVRVVVWTRRRCVIVSARFCYSPSINIYAHTNAIASQVDVWRECVCFLCAYVWGV